MNTCPHQSRDRSTGHFRCAIGWYGGAPYLGNCMDCLANHRNTPEAFAAFLSEHEKTHPPTAKKISGCCDRADQS
jgi:hypothetical protein